MSSPYFSLLLPTKDRYEMLVRMLESVQAAAPGVSWEAVVLYADPDERAKRLSERFPQVVFFDQAEHFPPGRPTWPAMMQFLLQKASAPWFMYASDDIIFTPNSISLALNALHNCDGLAGGVAMAYRNVSFSKPEWGDYGVDLTLGDQVLVNYGFLSTPLCKALGGFSNSYKFYCADGDMCLRVLESGYRIVPCLEAKVLHDNVLDELKASSNDLAEVDIARYREIWTPKYYNVTKVKRLLLDSPEQDPLLPQGECVKSVANIAGVPRMESGKDSLHSFKKAGLYTPGRPLRLHLGCGKNNMEGYVNIDYPPDRHSIMETKADAYAEIKELRFPDNSLDEIRLHHVFEHFNRVEALGLLIRWHRWLKVGGVLHIETPDLEGSARTILSDASFKEKSAAVRHLAGDQTDTWGYHIDHWFPARFQTTLKHLGFAEPKIGSEVWNRPPYLANVRAITKKVSDIPTEKLLQGADELLWLSTVAPSEVPTYEAWKKQLRKFLQYESVHGEPEKAASTSCSDLFPQQSEIALADIHDFNHRERERWVAAKAGATKEGSKVLDVGAGTCPFLSYFSHCEYKTHDFQKYEGVKLGGGTQYGEIDFTGDITDIPVPEGSFDVVLCTEVLEHVPHPVDALKEMARILVPGGRLLLTAPLGSGLHQEPYHYYGGFTRHFYEKFMPELGVEIAELKPNGGFMRHLAQECARVSWLLGDKRDLYGGHSEEIHELFRETLPRYLYALDEKMMVEGFTVGYFIEGIKL